ncbi:MAG TPA: type II toxin-antitoxin system prevent-host-death family antitoxin [Microcoleaceae bacterium UBA11344]|jgi:prevent-host-death family protein|nr:type II toxin-antitoxin system prevent-host-death family antitoxin [Microcoleaceae cyanobacterium UBA11344]
METVNIEQAKTNLSGLLSRVELGEEIIISTGGIPIAKLVPFRNSSNRRASLGQDRGRFIVPDDFNDPLPKEILAAFEGDEK